MRETELALPLDDGVAAAGTLALPDGDGPHPVALLLWPGGLDRDGDTPKAKLGLGRPFAQALAARGVASYRYDRRGTGATPGDPKQVPWNQNRTDALAVLRGLAARPDLGARALIGYSEGALNSAYLASRHEVAAAVLLASPARTGEEALLWWAERLRPDEIPGPVKMLLKLLGRTPSDQLARWCAKLRRSGDSPRLYGMRMPRSFRDYLLLDPRPDFAAITVPVLAITGTKDRNISPDDVDVIASLVRGQIETERMTDLTHLLRRDPGPASIRAYGEQYTRPIDPELVERIATWVTERLHRTAATTG